MATTDTGNTDSVNLDLAAIAAHIAALEVERDEASAEAEHLTAGMKEVALFRAANAQACLGHYARPLLDALLRQPEGDK